MTVGIGSLHRLPIQPPGRLPGFGFGTGRAARPQPSPFTLYSSVKTHTAVGALAWPLRKAL